MTHIGKCTKCRGKRTTLTVCKVEAFDGDARPVEARLCDACIDDIKRAVVTPLLEVEREIVEVYA